jgi:hypothetical protein
LLLKETHQLISIETNLNEYPIIKVMNKGHGITVWGTITKIEYVGWVEVKADKLKFD